MSSVMRPSGPLPQRVYWVRRLVLLAVVVVVITLIWSLVGRLLGNADGSEGGGGGANGGVPTATGTSGNPDDTANPPGDGQGSRHHHGHRGPAAPTGDCQPDDVAVNVVVGDAVAGAAVPVVLRFKSLTTPCTLSLTPSTLALRITSGDDVIWSSHDCPDELEARQLVVQPKPASTYEFGWDGNRSTDECLVSGKTAEDGGYWAEAALIGAEAHKSYFELR